jgi:tetratricopeptide (TPR) repeat protein
MNNLAEIYKAQGRYGEAEPLLREVLQGYRETLGPKHPDTLTSMNNLAGLYKAQGRYGEAEPLLREALQIRCETLGPKHPDTLGSMNNLAELYQSQGRTGDAEPLYREVLQISRETLGPAHPHTLGTQTNLVVLLAAEGRIPAAAALQAQMEPQVLGWLGSELYSTESVSVRRGLVASQATYQDLALSLALAPGADPAAAELAASALLRFKNLLADEDAYLAHLSRTSADPNIRAAAEHVRALHAARARLFQDEASAAQVEQVAQTARELDAAELELGRLSRTYSPSLQVRNVNVADLKAALASQPRRSVLLELRLFAPLDFRTGNGGAPHWAGVLVGGDGTVRVRDLGAVDDSLPAVQTTLAHPLDEAGGAAQAELHRRLIAPFAADLAGVERLYVAPDGALDLISFGLLRDASGAAMEAGMDVRLLLSGRDLLIQPPPQTAKGLVAVGGIDFGPSPATGAASGAAPKGDAPACAPDQDGRARRRGRIPGAGAAARGGRGQPAFGVRGAAA